MCVVLACWVHWTLNRFKINWLRQNILFTISSQVEARWNISRDLTDSLTVDELFKLSRLPQSKAWKTQFYCASLIKSVCLFWIYQQQKMNSCQLFKFHKLTKCLHCTLLRCNWNSVNENRPQLGENFILTLTVDEIICSFWGREKNANNQRYFSGPF